VTIEAWMSAAIADAERRGLPELRPLIEALAQATRALRAADLMQQEPGRAGLSGPGRAGLPGAESAGHSGAGRAGLSGPPDDK
jgi:hypothetical protein